MSPVRAFWPLFQSFFPALLSKKVIEALGLGGAPKEKHPKGHKGSKVAAAKAAVAAAKAAAATAKAAGYVTVATVRLPPNSSRYPVAPHRGHSTADARARERKGSLLVTVR